MQNYRFQFYDTNTSQLRKSVQKIDHFQTTLELQKDTLLPALY